MIAPRPALQSGVVSFEVGRPLMPELESQAGGVQDRGKVQHGQPRVILSALWKDRDIILADRGGANGEMSRLWDEIHCGRQYATSHPDKCI